MPQHRATAVAARASRSCTLPVDARGARTDLLAERRAAAAVLAPAHQFPTGVVLHAGAARGGDRVGARRAAE